MCSIDFVNAGHMHNLHHSARIQRILRSIMPRARRPISLGYVRLRPEHNAFITNVLWDRRGRLVKRLRGTDHSADLRPPANADTKEGHYRRFLDS
jgi:hypothetical protein